MQWHEKEEEYLKQLHDNCVLLSKTYMSLYLRTHSKQTKLRIPTIFLSSFSGVASFGSTSFPASSQKFVSIVVGLINVGIAMIQTYESYLKIGDIVSKSLSVSTSFKKLAEDIYCELYVPEADRISTGITFLRDCFTRYQTIMEQCPPLEDMTGTEAKCKTDSESLIHRISRDLKESEFFNHAKKNRTSSTMSHIMNNDHIVFGRTMFNANKISVSMPPTNMHSPVMTPTNNISSIGLTRMNNASTGTLRKIIEEPETEQEIKPADVAIEMPVSYPANIETTKISLKTLAPSPPPIPPKTHDTQQSQYSQDDKETDKK